VKSDKPHSNLMAWQKAMDLAVAVYEISKGFPREEVYSLTSQLRRAADSVPSNIAEGAADRATQQFSNFLSNSIGSLNEMDTQLELALRLGYLSKAEHLSIYKIMDECIALTFGLRKSLRRKATGREGSRWSTSADHQQTSAHSSLLAARLLLV
jgi:four helix bundle protein